MSNIKFKTNLIKEAEDYYETIHASPEQKDKAKGFSKVISKHLPLTERAVMGFFWRVIREYQMERHMASSEAKNLSKTERIQGLKEILDLLRKALTKILVKEDQVPMLDAAFDEIVKEYKASQT